MTEENKEPTNLRDTLQKINENLETLTKEKKVKKFKLPFKAKVGKNKAKKGWITVCFIDENRCVDFFKTQIDEGVIEDKKKIPHLATTEYMLNYKNKPMLIVPAWNIEPFAPDKDHEEASQKDGLTVGWRLLANHLESEQIKHKGSANWMWIILGILAVGGLAYYGFKQGWF